MSPGPYVERANVLECGGSHMPGLISVEWYGLRQVVSGGQDGVDLGALDGAKSLSFPTGGWMPKGWATTHGAEPSYATTYGMREHPSHGYPPRTIANVRDSDGTLILCTRPDSAGTALTRNTARSLMKPWRQVILPERIERVGGAGVWEVLARGSQAEFAVKDVASWIKEEGISVLNVAGNHKRPDYHYALTYHFVRALLTLLQG